MTIPKTAFLAIAIAFAGSIIAHAQCANSANIYLFHYDGRSYEVVKENRTWNQAAQCAVSSGGTLAEIDSAGEQAAIFNELSNNAGINVSMTVAPDGGNASYVWLGAHDFVQEGMWIWDGNSDGQGPQFWEGKTSSQGGYAVGGLYNNWGNEPDDYLNNQDALGLALTSWPRGSAGEWNDVAHDNQLYYIIEHPSIIPVELSLFRARQYEDAVMLSWRTETETGNFGWAVERSFEGGDWTELAFVGGAGTTLNPQSYEYIDRNLPNSGTLTYRIKQMDYDGATAYSPMAHVTYNALPSSAVLHQNHPNPFNPSTTIRYSLPEAMHVRLTVYDGLGREISLLFEGEVPAGTHEAAFDAGAELPSGLYFYRLETPMGCITKKMSLIE